MDDDEATAWDLLGIARAFPFFDPIEGNSDPFLGAEGAGGGGIEEAATSDCDFIDAFLPFFGIG